MSSSPGCRATFGIVAYRRPRPLGRLLDRVEGSDLDVVVVNVGADGAVRELCADRPGVRVIDVENRGYAAAVNAVAAAAQGDTIVFSNDDVMVDVESVERLVSVVAQGEADVAVPRVVQPDGAEVCTVLALPTPGRLLLEWAILPDTPPGGGRTYGVEKWRRPTTRQEIDASTAVMIAVRADVLRSTPLPEEYFLYWEELEWFWRLRAKGHRVVIEPGAHVVHDGGRADVRPDKSRLLARNAVRCVRRTQGRAAAATALLVVVLWNVRLFVLDGARAAMAPTPVGRERLRARLSGLRAAVGGWDEVR
jgi:GT2 family glycosyltransferase